MNFKNKTSRLALSGVLIALAFILSYLEALLPSFTGIPGVKPGLANIVTLVSMYILGWQYAVPIALVRVILAGLAFNGMSAMLYGLAGSALSLIVMLLLKKTGLFSCIATSLAGGIAHNLGQFLVAVCVLGRAVLYYLPFLIISGLIAGAAVGLIAGLVIRSGIISRKN